MGCDANDDHAWASCCANPEPQASRWAQYCLTLGPIARGSSRPAAFLCLRSSVMLAQLGLILALTVIAWSLNFAPAQTPEIGGGVEGLVPVPNPDYLPGFNNYTFVVDYGCDGPGWLSVPSAGGNQTRNETFSEWLDARLSNSTPAATLCGCRLYPWSGFAAFCVIFSVFGGVVAAFVVVCNCRTATTLTFTTDPWCCQSPGVLVFFSGSAFFLGVASLSTVTENDFAICAIQTCQWSGEFNAFYGFADAGYDLTAAVSNPLSLADSWLLATTIAPACPNIEILTALPTLQFRASYAPSPALSLQLAAWRHVLSALGAAALISALLPGLCGNWPALCPRPCTSARRAAADCELACTRCGASCRGPSPASVVASPVPTPVAPAPWCTCFDGGYWQRLGAALCPGCVSLPPPAAAPVLVSVSGKPAALLSPSEVALSVGAAASARQDVGPAVPAGVMMPGALIYPQPPSAPAL
jgi:hypothetical protein